MPKSLEYMKYCEAHWHELIDLYKPSVLWGDLGYPFGGDVLALSAHYYNHISNGVINDRFYQIDPKLFDRILWIPGVRSLVERIITRVCIGEQITSSKTCSDFMTSEYSARSNFKTKKWELCRGIGYSFGYNQNENETHMLSVEELVELFVDVVSKNGNLLLGIGPMADGTIPALQKERLEGLGGWLKTNGEAFFGTQPWHMAEAVTCEGIRLRFTQKPKTLYITLLDKPFNKAVTLRGLRCQADTEITPLDFRIKIKWKQSSEGIVISFLSLISCSSAIVLKFTPKPVDL
jgi:alpha-L-fucosidase